MTKGTSYVDQHLKALDKQAEDREAKGIFIGPEHQKPSDEGLKTISQEYAEAIEEVEEPMKGYIEAVSKDIKQNSTLLVYVDGACKGNPGPGAAGWCAEKEYFARFLYEYNEECTNNVAEYKAVEFGLSAYRNYKGTLIICSDSELVVNQMNGVWAIKDDTMLMLQGRCHNIRAQRDVKGLRTGIRYIPRRENFAHRHVQLALRVRTEVRNDETEVAKV